MSIINIFLEGIFKIVNYLLFIIIVLYSIKLFVKTYRLTKKYKNNLNEIEDFEKFSYSNKLIMDFTEEEFKLWCSNSLKKQGYKHINSIVDTPYLTCSKSDFNYLIYCSNSTGKVITENTLRYILGIMVTKKIYASMFISPSPLSDTGKEFIKTLPYEYKINIVKINEVINKTELNLTNILQQT